MVPRKRVVCYEVWVKMIGHQAKPGAGGNLSTGPSPITVAAWASD
jgi:hypothetical protein